MRVSSRLPLALVSASLLGSACAGNFTLSQADLSSLSVNAVVDDNQPGAMTIELYVSSRAFVQGTDCPVLDASTTATLDGVALDVDRGGANLPAGCRTPTIRGRFTTPTGGAGDLVFADATSTIHVTAPALGTTLWMEPSFDTTAVPRSGPWTFTLPVGDGLVGTSASMSSTCMSAVGSYDAAAGQVVLPAADAMTCQAGLRDPLSASLVGLLTPTLDERPLPEGLSDSAALAVPAAPSCSIDQDCIDVGAGSTCSGGFCNVVPDTASGLSFSSVWNRAVRWAP